ncbi:hypothetical protein N9L90_01815 [Planctomycetota bacterium]|jgi:hypothetical protein|nr:hypothetical protein [Planctomycetota bacterium]
MKPLLKLILKPAAIAALGLGALAAAGLITVPPVARAAVESGSEFAFGVPATLGSIKASPGLSTTTLGFSDYEIQSPEGFTEPLLTFGHFEVGVGTRSLVGDVKELGVLEIEDVQLTILQSGLRSNLAPVVSQLKSLADRTRQAEASEREPSTAPDGAEAEPKGPGPRLKVGRVRIAGIRARLKVDGIPGVQPVDETVELPVLERDWSSDSGEEGFTVADLSAHLLEELEISALEGLRGEVPDEVLDAVAKGLEGGLDSILDGASQELEGILGEKAGELLDAGSGLFGGR